MPAAGFAFGGFAFGGGLGHQFDQALTFGLRLDLGRVEFAAGGADFLGDLLGRTGGGRRSGDGPRG